MIKTFCDLCGEEKLPSSIFVNINFDLPVSKNETIDLCTDCFDNKLIDEHKKTDEYSEQELNDVLLQFINAQQDHKHNDRQYISFLEREISELLSYRFKPLEKIKVKNE